MRGTLGEYVVYKSYIVRKRERTPRLDTPNKIKMILIHILPPCPHSEKHTLLSLDAQAEAARAVASSARTPGGLGGAAGQAGG
jgi:hypothetical protein